MDSECPECAKDGEMCKDVEGDLDPDVVCLDVGGDRGEGNDLSDVLEGKTEERVQREERRAGHGGTNKVERLPRRKENLIFCDEVSVDQDTFRQMKITR